MKPEFMDTRFLIVGQGIAGSMFAWELMSRGLAPGSDFLVIDAGLEHGSSWISTGIINPVVFKRMTLSWGADLVPRAWQSYSELEAFLTRAVDAPLPGRFIRRMPVTRIFRNEGERSSWEQRLPDFELLGDPLQAPPLPSAIDRGFGSGEITDSGRILVRPLLCGMRAQLDSQAALIEARADSIVWAAPDVPADQNTRAPAGAAAGQDHRAHSADTAALPASPSAPAFRPMQLHSSLTDDRPGPTVRASVVILCTGIQRRYLPGAGSELPDHSLPFYPVKGDVLRLRLPELAGTEQGTETATSAGKRIFSSKIAIIPTDVPDEFLVGSSYVRDFTDAASDDEGIGWILRELSAIGLGPVEGLRARIIKRMSGIRPASRDRLAYLGPLSSGAGASESNPGAAGRASHTEPGHKKNAGRLPAVYTFNGLGTRGIMLAPGLAAMLADHLLEGTALPPELLPERVRR